MSAGEVEDGWWGDDIEFYFENVSGQGHDSGWIDSRLYIDNVPTSARDYGYRFQVRDPSGNLTEWSTILYAGQYINQPPLGPMNLSLIEATPSSLDILASRLTDREGVEYYMEIALGSEVIANSGWFEEDPNSTLDGPSYQFTDLTPDTTYRVRYMARDMSEDQLVTHEPSDWVEFTTLAAQETIPPDPINMTFETAAVDENNTYDGRPRWITTEPSYFISMQAVVATDADSPPVQYRFQGTYPNGSIRIDSGWIDSNIFTVTWDLNPLSYGLRFRVRARDSVGNVTNWSDDVIVAEDGYPVENGNNANAGQ
jgi:hypothetical protein